MSLSVILLIAASITALVLIPRFFIYSSDLLDSFDGEVISTISWSDKNWFVAVSDLVRPATHWKSGELRTEFLLVEFGPKWLGLFSKRRKIRLVGHRDEEFLLEALSGRGQLRFQ